MVAIWEN